MKCMPMFGAALLVAASCPLAAQGRPLSPAQMEEDLFAVSEAFVSLHAGRLRYSTEEEFDEAFGEALFAAGEERTPLEFFRIVSRVVASVRCGHTGVRLGGQIQRDVQDAAGLLPFDVLLDGERAWILRSYCDPLTAGAEIASINGHSIPEIRATAFSMMSGDGFIETGKERNLERAFSRLYVLLVQAPEEVGAGYEVQLVGAEEPVKVTGLTPAEFAERQPPRPQRPLMEVTLLPEQDLGILMVSQFGDRTGEDSFPDQLEASFERINESGVGHVVVDLRGNGGGNDNYGAQLVSYMATRTFEYFERIEVTADYDDVGGIIEKDGMRLVTEHRSLSPWEPAEHRFRGKVYLFEDGWTFSTAADVATVAHFNDFATLVGEESGGGYDGNTSGNSTRVLLPNSGLSVGCPMWMYTTANVGHDYPGRGAIPHQRVRPTVDDALAGRDVELEYVIGEIRGE